MKKSILKTLQSTIQGDVFSQKEFRQFYSVDASSYQIIPKVVVVPKNEKDVINAVKIAKKFKTSVTVRGAGTGLVGSALNNGIILEMKNFDSIRLAKDYVTIGPGTIKGKLDKKLEEHKKFFPPIPSIFFANSRIFFATLLFSGRVILFPFPSINVISVTLSITLPYFRLLLPLELFPNIPPIEQKEPIDGFGGKNFLCSSSFLSSLPLIVPGPIVTWSLASLIESQFFISSIIPLFNALPTRPVPAPRTVIDVLNFFANFTALITSFSFFGTTTTFGIIWYELASTE